MVPDFDEEIRKLRREMSDIDNVIAYFARLEARLSPNHKKPGKTGPQSATLLQMKHEAETDKS